MSKCRRQERTRGKRQRQTSAKERQLETRKNVDLTHTLLPQSKNELSRSHLCPDGKQQLVTSQCVASVPMAGRREGDAAEHQRGAEVIIADDSPVEAPPVGDHREHRRAVAASTRNVARSGN